MQVQESYSVPRRPLDIDDYIDIARRHAGWILGPLFAALVVSVVVAFIWPDTYVSVASIKVIPQQIPESLVQPNVNELMSDRITSMIPTVLSRGNLTGIIVTNDLYPRERERMPLQDVVQKMQGRVRITNVAPSPNGRVPAFQISFAYTDRVKAQKVVQEIATKFIDQNLRERSSTSRSTTELLHDEWLAAKKELDLTEAKLARFRAQNAGRLPDEMQSNLSQLNALQGRLAMINSSLSRVSQEKLQMETQLRIYKDQMNGIQQAATDPIAVAGRSEKYAEADRDVKYWEAQIAALHQHYKDTHPDVKHAQSMLAAAKSRREDALKEDEAKKKDDDTKKAEAPPPPRILNPTLVREARDLDASYRRLLSTIEAKDLEGEEYRKELGQVNDAIKAYEVRLQGTPFSEQAYSELIRDRELARSRFVDLDQKWTRSQLAQEMENRSQGERLEPLDPASLPQTPSEPNRLMIIGMGSAVGLAIGIMLAGAREVKDASLKNLKDVRAYTQLPILGSVPLLENDHVVKRRRRLAVLGWAVACLAGVAIISGSVVYYYYFTRV
jgi:polysaccharide chain length determinant protein (PEP-CTERM system associated)